MGNPYGDDEDPYEDMSDSERQLEEDVTQKMAEQGLTNEDFPDGVPYGAFVDVDSYKE